MILCAMFSNFNFNPLPNSSSTFLTLLMDHPFHIHDLIHYTSSLKFHQQTRTDIPLPCASVRQRNAHVPCSQLMRFQRLLMQPFAQAVSLPNILTLGWHLNRLEFMTARLLTHFNRPHRVSEGCYV